MARVENRDESIPYSRARMIVLEVVARVSTKPRCNMYFYKRKMTALFKETIDWSLITRTTTVMTNFCDYTNDASTKYKHFDLRARPWSRQPRLCPMKRVSETKRSNFLWSKANRSSLMAGFLCRSRNYDGNRGEMEHPRAFVAGATITSGEMGVGGPPGSRH